MAKKDIKSLYDKVVEGLSDKKSVPDYKTMCQILEEPNYDTRNDKKNRQFKYWRMCFDWRTRKKAFTQIKVLSKDEFENKVQQNLNKEQKKDEKRKKQTSLNRKKNYKLNYLLTGRHPSRPSSWDKRGVYIVYNNSEKNSYKQKTCYIGSTTTSFMQRFDIHVYQTKELIPFFKEPDTHINFLWFAEDSDTEEFIHEKESEYWALYKKKGYHMINSHIPEYHKSAKGYRKKTKFKSKEEYLQDKEWLTYKPITTKIPSDLQPLLIKFLREQLKLEYSEDYNLWTLPHMVDIIKDFEQKKKEDIKDGKENS